MKRQTVWDLPLRLFHWSLVVAGVAAVVTGKLGGNLIDWHGRIGLFILGLVAFRLVWGFVGSPTARFANFVRGPAAIKAYLQGRWQGIGHNPLGALAVLGLLGLTALQVVSGLFANDDIAFQGPLAELAGKARSDQLTGLHVWLFDGLLGIVGLHVAAIAFYARVKGRNLVRPMVTGHDELPADVAPPHHRPHSLGRRLAAFIAATAVASSVVYAAAGGLLPEAPPPAASQSAAPAW